MGMSRTRMLLLVALLQLGCATSADQLATREAATPVKRPPAGQELPMAMSEAQREALEMALEALRAEEWVVARDLLQELIIKEPKLAAAYANMGNVQQQLGEQQKAEQAWRKALELRPDWAAVYNQLGIFYRQQGRFSEALTMYQQAIAADEGHAKSQRNIAILYEFYLGDEKLALQHYRRYYELLGSGEHEVRLWIADLEQRLRGTAP